MRAGLALTGKPAPLAVLGPFTTDTIFPGYQQLSEESAFATLGALLWWWHRHDPATPEPA